MVSKAIDENLIDRLQRFVANDINSKILPIDPDNPVLPEDVFVISFERVLNNWIAICTNQMEVESFYKIVYDGERNQTIVTTYNVVMTFEAVL